MTTSYQRESIHERNINKRYEKLGFQYMRSAGSHGTADGVVWNNEQIIFWASQSVPWDIRKQELIWRSLLRPPNSLLMFFSFNKLGLEITEDADELAGKYGWIINPVSQELLEFGKKHKWDWVSIKR